MLNKWMSYDVENFDAESFNLVSTLVVGVGT